jgi:hypothetical protein
LNIFRRFVIPFGGGGPCFIGRDPPQGRLGTQVSMNYPAKYEYISAIREAGKSSRLSKFKQKII